MKEATVIGVPDKSDEALRIDNLVAWKREDGQIIMSVNDTKRGAALIRKATPTLPLQQRRRKWSDKLREAEWWIASARKSAKSGDYKASHSDVMMACFLLDNACQYDTETPE